MNAIENLQNWSEGVKEKCYVAMEINLEFSVPFGSSDIEVQIKF
jgi:hypothetical protein